MRKPARDIADRSMGEVLRKSKWVSHSNFYEKDLESNDLYVLAKAFAHIEYNVGILEAYFLEDGVSKSGSCLVEYLTDCGSAFCPHYTEDSLPTGYYAETRHGTKYTTFDWCYLRAVYNSYTSTTSPLRRDAYIADLASTIIHEASHSCLNHEKFAYIVAYYYLYQHYVATRNAYVCAKTPLRSWDPNDYTEGEVRALGGFYDYEEVDGVCYLTDCT